MNERGRCGKKLPIQIDISASIIAKFYDEVDDAGYRRLQNAIWIFIFAGATCINDKADLVLHSLAHQLRFY